MATGTRSKKSLIGVGLVRSSHMKEAASSRWVGPESLAGLIGITRAHVKPGGEVGDPVYGVRGEEGLGHRFHRSSNLKGVSLRAR